MGRAGLGRAGMGFDGMELFPHGVFVPFGEVFRVPWNGRSIEE